MRKLGGAARNVLAHKRHGQQPAALGAAGVDSGKVGRRENAVSHPIDLGQAVRQDGASPFGSLGRK